LLRDGLDVLRNGCVLEKLLCLVEGLLSELLVHGRIHGLSGWGRRLRGCLHFDMGILIVHCNMHLCGAAALCEGEPNALAPAPAFQGPIVSMSARWHPTLAA
jgi:hypothetical protein